MNRKILVTGASKGLGRCLAVGLATDASLIVVTARDKANLNPVIQEISSVNPRCEVLACAGDFSSQDGILKFIENIGEGVLNSIDVLINNAAMGRQEFFHKAKMDELAQMFSVNLIAPVMMSRMVLNGMIERKWGRIVNISSISARRPSETIAAYASTKIGLNGFTKALATEASQHGVSVNAIMPGFMKTEMGMEVIKRAMSKNPALTEEDVVKGLLRTTPTHSVTSLEDVLSLVRFLVGDQGGFMTGQVIGAAGGL